MFKKLLLMIVIGMIMPTHSIIPVQNATAKDWNSQSFWFAPWGKSGVHKGIDIFGKRGTPVLASTNGLVIYTGNIAMGGNVVAVLGAKWRIHYYAHLAQVDTHMLRWASQGEMIGKVGDTGNAAGKVPHLHYSIFSLVPNPAEITTETQGWKRMFYVNPIGTFS